MTAKKKILRIVAIILIIFIPIHLLFLVPELERMPSDFSYKADIFSLDNFYDEERQSFQGEQISYTKFSYDTVRVEDGILIVKNIFDVRTPSANPIFGVERSYGIDPRTGAHVPGYGDKDRQGYLFAPRNLNKQPYTYWHINYDSPAHLVFKGEEELFGLIVYRYETYYHADQTANLGHLPGVPEERGVNLDINLHVWVEPETGRLIKYEDNTIAYYYNITTGERIHPWNKFNNVYRDSSVVEQVTIAKAEKQNIFLIERATPLVFLIASGGFFMISRKARRKQ